MASVCREEIKAKLIAIGKWADAVRVRDDLKAGGMAPTLAMREACIRVAPGETDDIWAKVKHRAPRAKFRQAGTEGGAAAVGWDAGRVRPSLADAKLMARDNRIGGREEDSVDIEEDSCEWNAGDAEPDAKVGARVDVGSGAKCVAAADAGSGVDVSVFRGKSCSISAAFMWAYPMVGVDGVGPEDAPSAMAWQMLCDMRMSPSIRADLLKSGLGAAMRRAGDEEDCGNRFDGEGEYDICAAIAGASSDAGRSGP